MKLYYCFNGLCDYEYLIDDEKIIKTIYRLSGKIIECEAVEFYLNFYREQILDEFLDSAYWEYLGETKADFIDDRRLASYQRLIETEDEILGVRKDGRL